MPVFLEPGVSFPVVLKTDEDKPIESRPTFFAKSQSMRGQKKIADVLDRLSSDTDATIDVLFADIVDCLHGVLTGWSHMSGIEYSKDALVDVLSYSEARELLRKVAYNQHVTFEEKKSSE